MSWAAELRLFTNYRFDERDKAASLFRFLNSAGVFAPERFDAHEPVRKAYAPDALDEPISLLCGHPQYLYGEILLRGAKGHYLAWFKWSQASVSRWHIYLSQRFFDRPKAVEELTEFVAGLCSKFPPLYGGVAPKEDWDAKHVLVTRVPGGETHEKVGLDISECLPGIYWGTVFGAPVVGRLGLKEMAGRLPVARSIDLGEGGLLLVLRESPFTPELPERLRHDREVAHLIGGQYFFDKDDPDKVCAPVIKRGEG